MAKDSYGQGYDAGKAGAQITDNPYPIWGKQQAGWHNGCNDALAGRYKIPSTRAAIHKAILAGKL